MKRVLFDLKLGLNWGVIEREIVSRSVDGYHKLVEFMRRCVAVIK